MRRKPEPARAAEESPLDGDGWWDPEELDEEPFPEDGDFWLEDDEDED